MRTSSLSAMGIAWLATAGATAADCPTREDVARGLILEYQVQDNRGPVENLALYKRDAGDGRIAIANHPQLTGDPWERFDRAGVLVSEAQRRSGAQRTEVTFDAALDAALPPAPDSEATGVATWRTGNAISEIRYTLRSRSLEDVSIGECSYAGFPLVVTETREATGGGLRDTTRIGHYIPELGIFAAPPRRSVAGFTRVRSPSFVERFTWPFRGL